MKSNNSESPCKECSESSEDLDQEDLEYGSEQEFYQDDDDQKEKEKPSISLKFTKKDK